MRIKVLVFFLSALLVIMAVSLPTFAAAAVPQPATYTVETDLSKVEFVSGSPYILDGAIAVRNFGTVLGLGNLNFGFYTQVEIDYCSDKSAMSGDAGSSFAITNNTTPVWNVNDSQIIAQGQMSNAQGSWRDDVRTVSIDLTQVSYVGDTYLSVFMPDGNGVDILAIRFTCRSYTQAEVDALLNQFLNKDSAGAFENCTVNATVNYKLSLVDEGGAYTSHSKHYDDIPCDFGHHSVSFLSWYRSMKDDLFGDLSISDDYFITSINFSLTLYDPVNVYSLNLAGTAVPVDLSLSLNFIDEHFYSRSTIIEKSGDYVTFYEDPSWGVILPTNYNIMRLDFSISSTDFTNSWDELFIVDSFSLWADSSIFEQYREAYNDGYLSAKEYYEYVLDTERDVYYDRGYDAGYEEGHSLGYSNGYNDGHAVGFESGFTQGESEGYLLGFSECEREHKDTWYNSGYRVGFDEGRADGIKYAEGDSLGLKLDSLFFGIFDAPVRVATDFLNFEFLGFNLSVVFAGLLTLSLVLVVLAFINGKRGS